MTEPLPDYSSVSLGVWIKAGSVNECADNNGIAHLTEHMLFKGTRRRSARKLADDMTEIGDYVDAYTTKEYTCFYARTLYTHLDEAIDILSDMLTDSVIDEEDLQRELGVITEEIDMYDDSPEDIVNDRIEEAVWRDHPLGQLISGEKSAVRKFTRQDVIAFMNRYYTAERMVISISGRFDEEKTLALLGEAFGSIPEGGTDMRDPVIPDAVYHRSLFTKYKDIGQVHMNLTFESVKYGSEERYICTVANSILGGNGNSRLFQSVREDKGLAYEIYSYGSSYEKGGLFSIYSAFAPENMTEVIKAVLRIIDDLKLHEIPEHELHIAKEQVKTELILSDESTYNRMDSYGKYLIHGRQVESVEEACRGIDNVTGSDVMKFMRDHFDTGAMSMSAAGNLKGIRPEEMRKIREAFGEQGE